MKSNATTVKDYLASLPAERRAALEQVRKVILANLDPDYEECMLWGVAAYVVPHRVWPSGHHTDPAKPLMMCGISSQKNDMVVYLTNVYGGGGGRGGDAALRAWFEQAWVRAGKKLSMDGAGGCCLRFKKLEDVALDVLGEAVRRTPVQAYVAKHLELSAGGGKAAVGKKVEKAGKKSVKKVAPKAVKKVAKKKVAKR